MRKALTRIILTAIISLAAVTSLSAKTDTITLHLRATVPPRAEVTVTDGAYNVALNSDDVTFSAYDASGNPVGSSTGFASDSGAYRLCFTAA